jgi:hypothetical protein
MEVAEAAGNLSIDRAEVERGDARQRSRLVHRFDEIDHMVGFIFAETTCSLTA